MIHSQFFQRRASANDSSLVPTGCQKVPQCYCLRIQPALPANGPIAGLYTGQYPLTIHRSKGGDRIEVMDSEVIYFNKGLLPGKGASLVAWVGTLPMAGIADTWLMTWGDEPGDYIDPASDGAVYGPASVNVAIPIGARQAAPVLAGGIFDDLAGGNIARALEMLGYYGDKGAARVARKGEVLFDSGPVAAGALITTPAAMDFRGCDALEILVDNSAGAVFRDLTMDVCNEAGATLETLLLRKVAWGAAANGAQYAPGKVRGLISENPPGGVTGDFLLYDVVGPANAVHNTGPLITEDLDALAITERPSAAPGAAQISLFEVDDAGVDVGSHFVNIAAGSGPTVTSWGGGSAAPAGFYLGGLPTPPPRRIRVEAGALGAGVTCRVRVHGRGRRPGTFAVQMAVPPKARFKLLAGGAADGRLIVVAR